MAKFLVEFYSDSLRRSTTFQVLIPNDSPAGASRKETAYSRRPMKTLFLLHGYTGKSGNWVPEDLPGKYNFAVVMPSAENSFYLDGPATGHAFDRFVGVELVDYVRKTFGLARSPEDTYIAGMSMGGFGAVHLAMAHPDRFGKAGALSSALIVHEIARMKPGESNAVANYEYYRSCFGDLETAETRDVNPEVLIRRLRDTGAKIPDLYLCCGTEDFLIEPNRAFHRFLLEEKIPHEYFESPGEHNMVFWSEYIVKIVRWMFA